MVIKKYSKPVLIQAPVCHSCPAPAAIRPWTSRNEGGQLCRHGHRWVTTWPDTGTPSLSHCAAENTWRQTKKHHTYFMGNGVLWNLFNGYVLILFYFFNGCYKTKGRKNGNVLFNDPLKTFYLRLYGARHMVKDHSDSERGNPLPPHRLFF